MVDFSFLVLDWSYTCNAGAIARTATCFGTKLYLGPQLTEGENRVSVSGKTKKAVGHKAMQLTGSIEENFIPETLIHTFDKIVVLEDEVYWKRHKLESESLSVVRKGLCEEDSVLIVLGGEKQGVPEWLVKSCAKMPENQRHFCSISMVAAQGYHKHASLNLAATAMLAYGALAL